MSNLGPQHINLSFGGLLQLPNGVLPALQQVQDGNGNNAGLWISSTQTGVKKGVEVAIATASQTVFTLSSISYVTGQNMLSVFVDGVAQVSGTSFTETNSTTVTFSEGLHVGAIVQFIT